MSNAHSESLLARKLGAFFPLSPDDQRRLEALHSRRVNVKRGKSLVQEMQTGPTVYVLQRGWACSYKILRNGDRQIISFPVPGDCVGLRSALLQTADHYFTTLTDAVVSPIDGSRMLETFNEFPRLGAALLWAASRDEAMDVEHLVSVGRRSAIKRAAHFFLNLGERLRLVGLATETEFKCPLSPNDLADALGLSAIHISRVLRQLRERDLLTFHGGKVEFHDPSGLRKLAEFRDG